MEQQTEPISNMKHTYVEWGDGSHFKDINGHKYIQCGVCADFFCYDCDPGKMDEDCIPDEE